MEYFLAATGRWVSFSTVHWYKATREARTTAGSLLEEAPLRAEMDNLRKLVEASNRRGKPLRVAEMNTISNSGRDGVSNVLAAALWTLDGMFEVLAAGAVGVNLHQGAGQNLYTAIVRWWDKGKLAPVAIRPAFYAMDMWQRAARTDARLLPARVAWGPPNGGGGGADAGGALKVWPLWDEGARELRAVVINKRASEAADALLRIAGGRREDFQPDARVARLVAKGAAPLEARDGITIAGQSYQLGGKLVGSAVEETVKSEVSDGTQAWRVYMPPGSAALVTLKRKW